MSPSLILLIVALAAAGIALVLLILGEHRQREAGLPGGRVIYTDTSTWMKADKPLYDPDWGLTGKPDYLVISGKRTIPVEVKSTSAREPYPSHVLQLAAYCHLVQVQSGVRPDHGILHYSNATYEIEYTRELEARLKQLVDEIRSTPISEKVGRSHEQPSRCRACGYREICSDRLE